MTKALGPERRPVPGSFGAQQTQGKSCERDEGQIRRRWGSPVPVGVSLFWQMEEERYWALGPWFWDCLVLRTGPGSFLLRLMGGTPDGQPCLVGAEMQTHCPGWRAVRPEAETLFLSSPWLPMGHPAELASVRGTPRAALNTQQCVPGNINEITEQPPVWQLGGLVTGPTC